MGPSSHALRWLVGAAVLALTLALLVAPLALLIADGVRASAAAPTRGLLEAIGGATLLRAGARSLAIAGAVAVIALLPAYPLARATPASVLLALALVSPLARALGVLGLGAAPGVAAVILSQGAGAIPLAALLVHLRLRSRDPALLEAAADLGAGPWRRFVAVEAPLIAPACALAAGVVALASLGEIVSLELAGGGKVYSLALLLRDAVLEDGDALRSAVITVALVALAIPCALAIARGLASLSATGGRPAEVGVTGPGAGTRGRVRALGLRVAAGLAIAVALAPLVGLALTALVGIDSGSASLQASAGDRTLAAMIPTTLVLCAAVALVAVMIAVVVAAIDRGRSRWIGALLLLPLALPPVVHGALCLELGRAIGLRPGAALTLLGLLPARLALAYAGATLAVAIVGDDLRESAQDLGAGALARLRGLWAPLLGPALAALAVVVFAAALGEVAAPAFTSGPGGSTLAIGMAIVARGGEVGVVPRWALGLALAGLAAILGAGFYMSRRTGNSISPRPD